MELSVLFLLLGDKQNVSICQKDSCKNFLHWIEKYDIFSKYFLRLSRMFLDTLKYGMTIFTQYVGLVFWTHRAKSAGAVSKEKRTLPTHFLSLLLPAQLDDHPKETCRGGTLPPSIPFNVVRLAFHLLQMELYLGLILPVIVPLFSRSKL